MARRSHREFVPQAIDAYLELTSDRTKNHDFAEEMWENAVKLAMNHVPARIHEVVSTVSRRLIEIKRCDAVVVVVVPAA